MKEYSRLFKRRLAMVLAVVLTFTAACPVSAAGAADIPAVSGEAAFSEENAGPVEETSPDAAGTDGASALEEAPAPVPETESQPVEIPEADSSGSDPVIEVLSGDIVSSDNAGTEIPAGNSDEKETPADVTIMYYMVGSDLERNSVQTTKDLVEIMTGMKWAETAIDDPEFSAKVNVIAETGGLSFADTKEEKNRKAAYESERTALEKSYSQSANDTEIYGKLKGVNEGKGISWETNERWVLSGSSIKKAENDKDIETGGNRSRVMSYHLDEGKTGYVPELEDFIISTARDYPARNYMLVLWDHGGGPEGGYAGDERAVQGQNGYITSEMLSRSLSAASAGIRATGKDKEGVTLSSGSVSCNADFDKFAFIGFDACLMGNLETAMAVTPYADYLFASEDLEAGTGWDHRGYVKELLTHGTEDFEKGAIKKTTRAIGCKMAEDMMAWYEKDEDTDTIAVISLNQTQLSDLDKALGDLAQKIEYYMLAGNDGVFDTKNYPEFLKVLQKAVHFNGNSSGIVDLYSLCSELNKATGYTGETEIKAELDKVMKEIKPDDFSFYNDNDANPGPVIYESYTGYYPFANDGDDKKNLGGLTVFFPHDSFRNVNKEEDIDDDQLRSYLNIYYNGKGSDRIRQENKLGTGYQSLLKTFCSIQVVGSAIAGGFAKDDATVLNEMKTAAEAVKKDYNLKQDDIAYKTVDHMSEDGGLVKQRITVKDLDMKTVINCDDVDHQYHQYVYDVDWGKHSMINRITHQMMFTDAGGSVHRLGYLPDMEPASSVGDTNDYRFIPQNRETEKWFFMGDVPASIYSIQYIGDDPNLYNQFNALDTKNPVLVQIPAAMRKPTSLGKKDEGDDLVILEAELEPGTVSANPRGYYQLNIDKKQLFGFVPWSQVSADTAFWALSDLGEYMAGDESGFTENNYFATCYGTDMTKSEVIIRRGDDDCVVALQDPANPQNNRTNVKMQYILYDAFGGSYILDSLDDGEPVTARISVSKNGRAGSIDYMEEGEEGITPVIYYNTKEYSLSLNKNFNIGYNDEAGQFHLLETEADFKALKPGTYDLIFWNYDSEADAIAPYEGTKVSVDGVPYSIPVSNYRFSPEYSFWRFTVGNGKSSLTIEKKADLPYGFFKTLCLDPDDLAQFVSVKNGTGDVTKSYRTVFTVSAAGGKYSLGDPSQLDAFRSLSLAPGSRITVSADFEAGSDEWIHCPKAAELTIVRQPVKLCAQTPFSVYEYDYYNVLWESGFEETEIPKVKVLMQLNGRVFDDRKDGKYADKDTEWQITKLISANTVSAITLDTSEVNSAGTYENLPFGPRLAGKKQPDKWEDRYLSTEFRKYYVVENPEDALLEKYVVDPSSKVSFRSLKGTDDDEELYDTIFVDNLDEMKGDLWSVSKNDGLLKMQGEKVHQWYIRIGNQKRVPVWLDGEALPYYDSEDDADRILVVSANGAWKLYLPRSASSNTVCFYAGYEEASTTLEEKGSETFGITVDNILPVEYTGKALVTTLSTKTGVSKTIGLTLRDASGNALQEGTDYTVSYKNNKNVAGPSDNKAPTLVIRGKSKAYKKLKAEVKFTILPADLYYAYVTVNRKFAPFTGTGKLSATVTVKLPGGVKVPAANYDILYYDMDGNEITKEQMKELYKGDLAVPVEIRVRGKINTKKNALNNYRAGSETESLYVTGYPKGSKALSVRLKQSKQKFEAGKPVKAGELAKEMLKSVKIGSKNVDAADLKEVTAYYDSRFTQPAADNGKLMDRAGVYYLCFELKDEKKGRTEPQYPAYYATAVRYNLTGTSVQKGKTKLENTKLSYTGIGNNVSVNILFDQTKMKAEELYMTYTVRDGSTGGGSVGYKKNAVNGVTYDFYIDDNGKLFTDTIDNGAAGTYKITLEARGAYTGKFSLSYKVK